MSLRSELTDADDNTRAAQRKETPQAMQQRWIKELTAARETSRKWREQGREITRVYLDQRESLYDDDSASRLNLFSANVNTLRAMLYGSKPDIDVTREYADADDDVARVAAQIMKRMLSVDDSIERALGLALEDRLLVGLGHARVRYEAEFETVEHPPVTMPDGQMLAEAWSEEKKTSEKAIIEHVNWRDILWSAARTWDEVRWIAFRSHMSRKALEKRFGEEIGERIPLTGSAVGDGRDLDDLSLSRQRRTTEGKRGEIWEVWSLDDKMVYWISEGMDSVCDAMQDPLGLKDFYPCPPLMIANSTSAAYLPRADYTLAKDQYRQIDALTSRIALLVTALRVAGVYDRSSTGVQRLVTEAAENELIPVDSWAAFAERGGLKGSIDWLPIDQIATVIKLLTEQRESLIALLYQATGMSDIMRGASNASETATAQSIKARFASVRVQHLQDSFASFATGLQRLRAEIIVKHFDDETIVSRSGMTRTPDAQLIQPALQLLRDPEAEWRINIDSESMAARDMAAIQSERSQFMQGLASFLGAATPLVQQYPDAAPGLLEMLKWGMAGFRGSATIEGVLDQAIASMKKAPPSPPKPDPVAARAKADIEKLKIQGGQKENEIRLQTTADLAKTRAEAQADIATQAAQAFFDVRSGRAPQKP